MKKKYLSFLELSKNARDCGLVKDTPGVVSKAAQTLLLKELILRCSPEKQYSTYVAYKELSRSTGLSIWTLKRAAGALINAGLINIKLRPNHSNMWFINAKVMQEPAEAHRAERRAERERLQEPKSPFGMPIVAGETDEPGVSEVEFSSCKPSKADAAGVNRILTMLSQNFGNHPTYEHKDADNMLRKCVTDCCEIAGSAERVEKVLEHAFADPATRKRIDKSDSLGGFIRACMKNWLQKLEGDGSSDDDGVKASSDDPAFDPDEEGLPL